MASLCDPWCHFSCFWAAERETGREMCFSEPCSACVGALGPVLYAFVATTIMPREEEGYEDQEHLAETALLGGASFPGVTGRAG